MGKRRYDAKKLSKVLGLNVRRLRNECGWTLEDCEDHGWLNWRVLQEIETGKGNITMKTLVNLANLFDISPHELLNPAR